MRMLILLLVVASATASPPACAQAKLPQAPPTATAAAADFARQAEAAYDRKDYPVSADLYAKAIGAGDRRNDTYYNAACAFALAGRRDQAFDLLSMALAAGYESFSHLKSDSDLTGLHDDIRWTSLLSRLHEAHPEIALQDLMLDDKRSLPARYFPVHRALAGGMAAPDKRTSPFLQYYATLASMMGEYDEAGANYLGGLTKGIDPVAKGYTRAVPAKALLLERAHGRQAVFLNESHADGQTRALLFTLLAPLRREGFTHLALEALAAPDPEPSGATACAAPKLWDTELPKRGYPVDKTGYYTREPVFGEIVREALRLGFTLVSYEGGGNLGPREQHQANMLGCLFKADPKTRLLVIAGFSHISEQKDFDYTGGRMAYRFKALTGIDPLTVNTTNLLKLDPAQLRFLKDDKGRAAQGYALLNGKGQAFTTPGFDMMLYIRAPAHRNDDGGSWLELDGARKRSVIAAEICDGRAPCLLEARATGESADGIPSDRCVIGKVGARGCNLYLRPGEYLLYAFDETYTQIDMRQHRVK